MRRRKGGGYERATWRMGKTGANQGGGASVWRSHFQMKDQSAHVTHFSYSILRSEVSYVFASKPGEHGDDHNGNRASGIHGCSSSTGAQARVSRRAGGGGRDRRLGKKHPALSAETLAGNRRVSDSLHGMEFFAAGEIG